MENQPIIPLIDTTDYTQSKPKASELFKQSFAILKSDKELALFPICSAIFSIIGAVIVGVLFLVFHSTVMHGKSSPANYAFLFLYYLVIYFVAIYFNVGLTASVLMKFRSTESPKFRYGLQQANAHLGTIFGYSMIAATVGLALSVLANKKNIVGKIIANLFSTIWSIATIFIAPVIVTTNLSPVEAIKFSAEVFKSTWGNSFKGMFGFFVFGFLGIVIVLIPAVAGILLNNPVGFAIGACISILGTIGVSVFISTCTAIFRTALYHYATTKQVPAGFSSNIPLAIK